MAYALEIQDVHKVFNRGTINEKVALNGVNLNLNPGDFVTIIGGNGAGKSTTLNAIAGVWPIDSGKIIIDGTDITNLPEHKRAKYLGRVFQDPMTGTAATMDIEENMAIALRRGEKRTLRWGVSREDRELFREKLQTLGLGLEDRMTSKVGLLSGGQRQAITLLMAALKQPKLLLLDEHTAALDPKTAAKVLEISDKIIEETGKPDLFKAVRRLARMLEGAFTILATDVRQPDIVVGARHDSPLVVGLGEGENFLGSDVAAFVAYTKRAMEIDQDQAVMVSADKVVVSDFMGNIVPDPKTYTVDWDASAAEKGGWDSFMDKEIHEDPAAVQRTLLGRLDENGNINLDEVRIDEHDFKAIDKIIVIACGTAAYAGMVAKYAIEHWVRIPVEVELAHEFRYRDPILTPRTLVVAISQSGETMDTLMALRHAREQGSKVLAICNTQGASIPRESDAVLYTHAGPEVAVASTKAFVAQITAAYVLGLYLAQVKGAMYRDEIAQTLESLKDMPRKIQWILDTQTKTVQEAAEQMVDAKSFLFLGRHVGYPVAMEGALKLKEIAYTFTEGFAAGELKHGPIALVDEGEPVVFIVPPARGRNVLHSKVISGIEEVKARGAYIIAVAEEHDPDVERYADVVFWRPACPTLMSPLVDVVPLQLFAMDMAKLKNYDVDKPRNLAKSVTVE